MIKTHRCNRIKSLEKKLSTLTWLLTKQYKGELHIEYNKVSKNLEIQKAYRTHELSGE